ncbi:MAG: dienelactone hydrolase family protein [Bacteroidia bacterium]
MKNLFFQICFIATLFVSTTTMGQRKITFLSTDNLIVTADLYLVNDTLPYMVLCHQAGYSRGEYQETAKKFSRLGYNCIAVDLRSGKEVNGEIDETANLAEAKRMPTDFMSAEKDILGAINYAFNQNGKRVLLVGSSYSASLALMIAVTNEKVKAVMAFSPGEYLKNVNVKVAIKNLDKAVFIASTREEAPKVAELAKDIVSKHKIVFAPATVGEHGSKALWVEDPSYHEYWLAILMFMRQVPKN